MIVFQPKYRKDSKNKNRICCQKDDCIKRPTYGYHRNQSIFCHQHKLKNMKDVINTICEIEKCDKRAYYGNNENKTRFCNKHKKKLMQRNYIINCKEKDCNTQPNFGFPNNKPEYCVKHKKKNMIDIVNKTCEEEKCNIQPSYGYIKNKPKKCANHKKKDMYDVTNKMCQDKNCKILASYGYERYKPKFCKKHLKKNMKLVCGQFCKEKTCNKSASFGYDKGIKLYCINHKKDNMIYVYDKCITCNKKASFGYEWQKPLYCNYHKKSDMKDVKNILCKNCEFIRQHQQYKPYCFKCYCIKNPNLEIVRRFKTKETEIHRIISHTFTNEHVIYNKKLRNCKYFPDWLIEKENKLLIIECDENQHIYEPCDMKRMLDIFQTFKKPIIFIRFNPDKFIDKDGRKIPSMFYYNKNKLHFREKEFELRKNKLIQIIGKYLNVNVLKKEFNIEYLFYNSKISD